MNTTRKQIRRAAVDILKIARTDAKASIFSPDDWPTVPGDYPIVIVRTPHESRQNNAGRNGCPSFWSTISLVIVGRVEASDEAVAERALENLSEQIELAFLTNSKFTYENGIQQFTSSETSMTVVAEGGKHHGETVIHFSLEVSQIYPPSIDAAGNSIFQPMNEMDITIQQPLGTQEPGLIINLT